MEYRKIGNLEVSPVGMGCMGFSHGYGKTPEREYSIEAIRGAYDYGCTFFDTAESYGREVFWPGHNEEIAGEALEPFRSKAVLATKLHLEKAETEHGILPAIRKHLEASMKRLRTDYIDLYYLHRVNEEIPTEEIAEAMGRLIDEGVIRGWGLSQVDAGTLDMVHSITRVTAVQSIYSMVERDVEKDIIPYCLEHGIGFVPFSPIASGFLSGKVTAETKFEGDDVRKFVPQLSAENMAANQPILDVISRYAKEKNATNAQISLAWMLHKWPNTVPIPGSKNKERIIENLGSWNVSLTEEEFQSLEAALAGCTVYGHRGHIESHQHTFSNRWLGKG